MALDLALAPYTYIVHPLFAVHITDKIMVCARTRMICQLEKLYVPCVLWAVSVRCLPLRLVGMVHFWCAPYNHAEAQAYAKAIKILQKREVHHVVLHRISDIVPLKFQTTYGQQQQNHYSKFSGIQISIFSARKEKKTNIQVYLNLWISLAKRRENDA